MFCAPENAETLMNKAMDILRYMHNNDVFSVMSIIWQPQGYYRVAFQKFADTM